jgi:transcriptional regulator with XRE-family HTH domain
MLQWWQPMRLGELIKLSRELKGWTLRDLEERSGISNGLLSQIETGRVKDPAFGRVVAIARALGLKLERLAKCEK